MQPAPIVSNVSSSSPSIQRLSIEYDGWWMKQRSAHFVEDPGRLDGAFGGVGRDAGVQRPSRPHGGVERAHRLFERGVRIEAVRIEDVDVIHAPCA